ncbi:MAG: DUF4381 domain-containing protein [Alphaproteobacteria bacterium]|nr:DUF4381 domain-containing protein [Alphaproteobacteria bacterium]
MNPEIDLSGLKDLHYPVSPSWWPLAWGWYMILGTLLLLTLIIIYKRRNSPLIYANREMKKIQTEAAEKQLKLLSQLLKRVAMARYGREAIAPLSEDAWQEFLLAVAPKVLTKEEAHQLAYAIYNPNPKTPDKKLYSSCQKWIEKVLKKNPR